MKESIAYNRSLIGKPGSAAEIDTPALVLDLDAFESNIAIMAELARKRGHGLRPHAKTHKCANIARAQLEAGAVGICCAKLSEAETLTDEGIKPILITAAIVTPAKIQRLLALNARAEGLMVVADEPGNAKALAEAAAAAGQHLRVLIDCDVGTHRFGVPSERDALEMAAIINEAPSLELMGIQGYAGHVQSIKDYAERRTAVLKAVAVLGGVRDALLKAGYPCGIVTGGGTGSHEFDHEPGVFTDLQVGSYIFMDVIYHAIDMTPEGGKRFTPSLFVFTRVVSNRHSEFVTTDAGSKCFSMDGPAPAVLEGAPEGSTYGRFGDQFGRVVLPEGSNETLPLGRLVKCLTPHCDPTLNNFDWLHCIRGDKLVDIWKIDARGAYA